MLSTLAYEEFLLGECSRYDYGTFSDYPLSDGTGVTDWIEWRSYSDASFTNRLVCHYFIAQELASSSFANRISAEYPQRWVLMFLAVLNVELVVAIPPSLQAHADARLVREIVFCLVENAIHAVTYNNTERRGRVEIRGLVSNEQIRLEILDNGPGVHPGDTTRVFEPRVTTKKGGEHLPLGTGMGLPIARRYARLMAGDVDIDTTRSETCFFVELPRTAKEGST